jgi:endonuclease III
VSEKSKRLSDLLAQVELPSTALPATEGRTLLEVGFLFVIGRRLSDAAADKTLNALKASYPDWNELRVTQAQEFAPLVQTRKDDLAMQVARDVREYLQEVFQKFHGFDLDTVRGDLNEAARVASSLNYLGASAGHFLLHLAVPEEVPVSPSVVRTLDRLGLIKRTTSLKKAQASVGALVPREQWAEFAVRIGLVIERWCDARRPVCWECPLVVSCPHGKKAEREWKAAQKRLELQRAREEERARKEAEKERKRAAADEKRRMIAKTKEEARKQREMKRAKAKLIAVRNAAAKKAKDTKVKTERQAKARAAKAKTTKAKAAKTRTVKTRKVKAAKAAKARKTKGRTTKRGTGSAKRATGASSRKKASVRTKSARKKAVRKKVTKATNVSKKAKKTTRKKPSTASKGSGKRKTTRRSGKTR